MSSARDGRHPDDRRVVDRPTSTFKPRRRGLSPARQTALEAHLVRYGLDEDGPPLDLVATFGRVAPVVLDVGIGDGLATVDLAASDRERDVLGVEVHTPGVATAVEGAARRGLDNLRVVHGDVLVFLGRLAPGSLDEVRVLFPDPWPKQRQRHRRLLRADVLGALTERLRVGGRLHVATDARHVADEVLAWIVADRRVDGGEVARVARPVTRFEQRALDEGRAVTDLIAARVA